jgi:putative transposase
MPRRCYQWRNLSPNERQEILLSRKRRGRPWHSPPHRDNANGSGNLYHLTAACYEHLPIIGASLSRKDQFAESLLQTFEGCRASCHAWCVLPNHYHALTESRDVSDLVDKLGQLHGRSAYNWNGHDDARGRKVFYRCVERGMRSQRHAWTTINYIHNNPVRHSYVERWTDWPWSSAQAFLAAFGRQEAVRIWHRYPVLDYGAGWDDAAL